MSVQQDSTDVPEVLRLWWIAEGPEGYDTQVILPHPSEGLVRVRCTEVRADITTQRVQLFPSLVLYGEQSGTLVVWSREDQRALCSFIRDTSDPCVPEQVLWALFSGEEADEWEEERFPRDTLVSMLEITFTQEYQSVFQAGFQVACTIAPIVLLSWGMDAPLPHAAEYAGGAQNEAFVNFCRMCGIPTPYA